MRKNTVNVRSHGNLICLPGCSESRWAETTLVLPASRQCRHAAVRQIRPRWRTHLTHLTLDFHLQICQQSLDFLYEDKIHRQVVEFTFKLVDEIIGL